MYSLPTESIRDLKVKSFFLVNNIMQKKKKATTKKFHVKYLKKKIIHMF